MEGDASSASYFLAGEAGMQSARLHHCKLHLHAGSPNNGTLKINLLQLILAPCPASQTVLQKVWPNAIKT